jgi:adenylate cyclase
MADIFLSYASEDRERIRPLVEALEAQGWTVWWDTRIQPGQSFDNVIQNEIDDARCVIVAWTEHSINSEWVKNEATIGLERGVLVPVMFDEVRIPLPFVRTQSADLREWSPDRVSAEMQDFLNAVAGHLDAEAPEQVIVPKRWGRGSPKWYLTIAAVVAAIVALAVLELRTPTIAPLFEDEAAPNTITVAKFADRTPTHDHAWVGEVITDELRISLSTRGLQVVGVDGANLDQVRARYLVKGTVRRLGNMIRVTGELISLENQHVLWSDLYDREFTTSELTAQSEIVANMVDEVVLRIFEGGAPALIAATPPEAGAGALDGLLDTQASFPEFPTLDEGGSDE